MKKSLHFNIMKIIILNNSIVFYLDVLIMEFNMIKQILNKIFGYTENQIYNFILPESSNNIEENEFNKNDNTIVSKTLKKNITYLQIKYNMLINSDIKIRKFTLNFNHTKHSSFLIYIDGMVNDETINNYILKPLFLSNDIKMKENTKKIENKTTKKIYYRFNLENYLYSCLIPENSVFKENKFSKIISYINSGFCILFVDNLSNALCIETKGYKGRNVDKPVTETVVKGSHEGFVENLRTNTSMLRKIINNEKLIIEETEVGSLSKTKVAICYMKGITNDDLVSECKYRINNLKLDYLISSGQLEQFIKDNPTGPFPQTISTERPDKASNYLLLGRVVILVNSSPFAIILPAVLIDFLSSPEDFNLDFNYANFLRFLRIIALFCALLTPGLYIAITTYHFEIIPSELLFAIVAAREAIPFPILFEIIIMEISFELIQEASIRVPSSFSTTIGIIGALILGDAAVSASIVSPILIIIVAFTGISAFAIPDNSLRFAIRMYRFMYTILGYLAGFLGIALGLFIHLLTLSSQYSFGVPFFTPYIPFDNFTKNESLYINPVWKREKRNLFLNTKKPNIEPQISMEWRKK